MKKLDTHFNLLVDSDNLPPLEAIRWADYGECSNQSVIQYLKRILNVKRRVGWNYPRHLEFHGVLQHLAYKMPSGTLQHVQSELALKNLGWDFRCKGKKP